MSLSTESPHLLGLIIASRIQAFFAHHIHACRLFHEPSFLASLDLHPTDPKFPNRAIIHAMCAVGSLYTGGLFSNGNNGGYGCTSTSFYLPDSEFTWGPVDMATGEHLKDVPRVISFGDQQAKYAKNAIEENIDLGEKLFECLQSESTHSSIFPLTNVSLAQIILTWFYYSQARYAKPLCLCTMRLLRLIIDGSKHVFRLLRPPGSAFRVHSTFALLSTVLPPLSHSTANHPPFCLPLKPSSRTK